MFFTPKAIRFFRNAYNTYVNSVLAASNQRVADAHAAVKQAADARSAVYAALFDVQPVGPSAAANDDK